MTSATTFYQDADGDGYGDSLVTLDACVADGFITNGEDCNDAEATVNPDANEQCDDLDNDCDGEVDEDATDASEWYADLDDDGYGDSAADVVLACTEPDHSSARAGDCDDEDAGVNPGADETCDGKDNSCNAEVDEGAEDLTIYYLDADGDGYGASSGRLPPVISPMERRSTTATATTTMRASTRPLKKATMTWISAVMALLGRRPGWRRRDRVRGLRRLRSRHQP